jgi:hypothetical protein
MFPARMAIKSCLVSSHSCQGVWQLKDFCAKSILYLTKMLSRYRLATEIADEGLSGNVAC